MLAFEPFCSLTAAGERHYAAQWASWLAREFQPEFLLYWVLFLLLLYGLKNRGLYFYARLQNQGRVLRGLAVLFPAFLTLGTQWFQTQGRSHFEDEFAYRYQAEALARGVYPGVQVPKAVRATAQVPNLYYNSDDVLVGIYSPGYPLWLAPFQRLGLAWLGNWLLQVLALSLMVYWLYQSFGDEVPALWVCIIGSPWLSLFPAWYFSQTLAMVLILGVLIRLRYDSQPCWKDYFLASILFLVRTPDGLILFAALVFRQLAAGRPSLSFLSFFSLWPLHFWNQKLITGEWFAATYTVFSKWHKLGFGPDIGILEPWGFSLSQAFSNFLLVLLSLNDVFLGLPQFSLVPVVLGLLLSLGSSGPRSRFLLWFCFFWFGLYFCYFYPGLAFGPRFHYPLLPVLFYFLGKAVQRYNLLGRLLICLLPVCFLSTARYVHLFEDAAGVMTRPLKRLSAMGVELENYDCVVIPSMGMSEEERLQYTSDYRTLFAAFHEYNSIFEGDYRFVKMQDYERRTSFFQDKYKDRILVLRVRRGDILKILRSRQGENEAQHSDSVLQ